MSFSDMTETPSMAAQRVGAYTPKRKQGEFYRFKPRSSWCREGYARATENGALVDTYWGLDASAYDYALLPDEADTATLHFDSAEYDMLPQYDSYSAHRWAEYHPDDRKKVSSQHGCNVAYFVRKGAKPDLETKIAIARERLSEAQQELKSAQFSIELRTRDLNELLEKQSNEH